MSYQERKTIGSILTGILVLAAYCIHSFGAKGPDGDLKSWAVTMLVFIGIGIAASIVVQIVFHIALSVSLAVKKQINDGACDEKEVEKEIELEMVEDEMDKLIGLKSMRIGFALAGFGFAAALVSLVLNFSQIVMLNILFIAFSVGAITEGITQLYYYRKGIRNG